MPTRSAPPRLSLLSALLSALPLGAVTAACGGVAPPAPPSVEIPWPHSVAGFDAALVEALEAARAEVREHPDDAKAWMRLGMTYEAHVMMEHAGACYARAVELRADDPKAWYRLAVMRSSDGDVDGALAAYDEVHALAPGYDAAHRRRGRLLIGVGRPEEARAAFERVRELVPGDVGAALGLAEVELELGDATAALAGLAAIPKVPTSHRGLFHQLRGTALSRLERHDEAAPDLVLGRGARAGGADPWMREVGALKVGESAVLLRVDRLIEGGQPQEALELLRGLEERDGEDPRIFTQKGRALARLGQWKRAAAALARASELDPGDQRRALAAASGLLQAGDTEGAIELSQRLVEIDPADVRGQLLHADLLLGAGRFADSVLAVEEGRAAGVVSADLEVIGGKAELERGAPAAALIAFERALALEGGSADALAGSALAHLQLGDAARARASAERLRAAAPAHPMLGPIQAALEGEGDAR